MADYYEILGVSASASARELYGAYKKKALLLHPDKPGGTTEAFQNAQMAFETLSDPQRRAHYDSCVLGSTSQWDEAQAGYADLTLCRQMREATLEAKKDVQVSCANLQRDGREMREGTRAASKELEGLWDIASDLQRRIKEAEEKKMRQKKCGSEGPSIEALKPRGVEEGAGHTLHPHEPRCLSGYPTKGPAHHPPTHPPHAPVEVESCGRAEFGGSLRRSTSNSSLTSSMPSTPSDVDDADAAESVFSKDVWP